MIKNGTRFVLIVAAFVALSLALGPEARVEAQSGFQQVVARHSKKCLDIRGASTSARAPAQQFTCKGSSNQLWPLLTRVNVLMSGAGAPKAAPSSSSSLARGAATSNGTWPHRPVAEPSC